MPAYFAFPLHRFKLRSHKLSTRMSVRTKCYRSCCQESRKGWTFIHRKFALISTSFPVASDLRGWKEWWEGSLPVRALRPFPWSPSRASHLTLVLSLLACSVLPLSLGKVYGGGSTGGYLKLGMPKKITNETWDWLREKEPLLWGFDNCDHHGNDECGRDQAEWWHFLSKFLGRKK